MTKNFLFSRTMALLLAVAAAFPVLAASKPAGELPAPDALKQRIVARYDAWKAMDLKGLYGFLTETKRKSMSYESFIVNHRPKMELAQYEIIELKCDTEESCGAEIRLSLKQLPVKGGGPGPVDIVKPERWIRENGEWYVYIK
jgi:hypothetical protein